MLAVRTQAMARSPVVWQSWGQHIGMASGTDRWVRRMGHHVWAGQQAGWQGQRDRMASPHTSLCSSTAPPPQHGKAAPRAGVRACRAFIHHTTSRHDTGVQGGVGREPVIGAGGALHATLAWAGERRQEDRAGASVALPKTPRVSPQAGHWRMGRTGAESMEGLG